MHDMSPKIKCKCQKQNIFTPRHFQLEGNALKSKREKIKDTERVWTNFMEPGLKIISLIDSAGVAANTNNPQADQATSKF